VSRNLHRRRKKIAWHGTCSVYLAFLSNEPDSTASAQPRRHLVFEGLRPPWLRRDASGFLPLDQKFWRGLSGLNLRF
jgi:hypothetical protein